MKDQDFGGFIAALADAPDTQLDAQGAALCAEYDSDQDPIRFLRNLLDLSVRYAWGSKFVILSLQSAISDAPPETEAEAEERRQDLLAIWEPAL